MPRDKIILACSDCKNRNYFTTKNKRLHPERNQIELNDGTAIDYDGATGVTLLEGGDASGSFAEDEIKDGKWEIVGYR